MKKIVSFAVDFPITILMVVLAVLLLGYISFDKLGVDLFPKLNNPRLYILLDAGERPPEEIEKNFTDNLESLAIRQSGVVQVSSISKVGAAQITVEYAWDKDMDEAFLELQKAVSSVSQNWDVDDLTISQYDPNASPVMIVALYNPSITDMSGMKQTAENYIRNELIRLEGIADVEISGAEQKEVNILTNDYILKSHGLTLTDIQNQIDKFNRNVSGGSIIEMGRQYIIKGVSTYNSITDFENTIVKYTHTIENDSVIRAPIYLKDIAKVSFINKEPENIVRINGKRCIGLSIYKETKYNTVKAVDELKTELIKIRKAMPGYEFTIVQNQGKFINSAIDEVEESAIAGILLAVIIIFVFLRRMRVTAVISAAIPISIVATFNLMYFDGLSVNIMTLGGLALGAGMLVDNAIVVMESIFRNLESGMTLREAAVTGTAQVGGAITASTITTIIVFLPIVYIHGASGELFKDQAWTVAFSLLSSLFAAIFFIPVLSVFLLKNKKQESKKSIHFNGYSRLLTSILNRRFQIVIAAAALLAAAFLIIPFIGSEFMPQSESKEITIDLKLPEGTELNRTSETAASLENIFQEAFPDYLISLYSRSGPSSGISKSEQSFFEGTNTAEIKLRISDKIKSGSSRIRQKLVSILNGVPELEYKFVESENPLAQILGTDEAPITVEISGEDLDVLNKLTDSAKEKLSQINLLTNLESSFEGGSPVIEVKIDRFRAGIYNLTVDQITSQIKDQLNGKNAGQWDYRGEMNDITLKLPKISLKQLRDLPIKTGGQEFRLSEVASIAQSNSPKEIYRRNQTRIGKVNALIAADEPFDFIVKKIKDKLSEIDLPKDYKVKVTGQELLRQESMRNLTFALLLSIILVYMALASQFESLVHPFTILLTIPLAGVGAILIFFILGMPLNIMAFIGIIMLTGIAVNDSIILVDRINQLKKEGLNRTEAITLAGQQRIRPIIMTSLTTILALLPLTLGFGESASLRSPMALAVIGGLVTSTILTLVVIPCVYYYFDVMREKLNIKL